MPRRPASNGRQSSGDTSSSELKPNRTAAAQRIDAADDRRIRETQANQALGLREDLGAR